MVTSPTLERLRSIDDYDFERFIADLWERQGWDTELTQQGGDEGLDVLAVTHHPVETRAAIQVKQHGPNSKVSRPEIQQYHSLKKRFNTDTVIVVTTNEFSEPAKEMADDLNVKRVNGKRLLEIIRDNDAQDLVDQYAPSSRPLAQLSQSVEGIFQTSSSGNGGLSQRQAAAIFIGAMVALLLITGTPGSQGSNTTALQTNSTIVNTDFQVTQIDEAATEDTFILFVNHERYADGYSRISECDNSGENVSALKVPLGEPVERTWANSSTTIYTSNGLGRFLAKHWIQSNQTKSVLLDPQTNALGIRLSHYSDGVITRLLECTS